MALRDNIKRDYIEYLTPMYIKQYGYNERIAKKAAEDVAKGIMRSHPNYKRKRRILGRITNERIDEKELKGLILKKYLEK